MTDFHAIYRERADEYDLLVSREDYEGHLLPAIESACPLENLDVVEFGAGSGRLTRLLAPRVRAIRAFDASAAMLAVAERTLSRLTSRNWSVEFGENEAIPCEDSSAHLAIAGWTFGHLTGWHPSDWRGRVAEVLAEMFRVVRPGGCAIILETLGTGHESPAAPTRALADYYELLEDNYGFESRAIRTDYRFESLEEADRLTRFFFGGELADRVVREGLVVLPECTGIWSARIAAS
ncbi:class I SAM-dependent methyltransferase [Candidatus Poribacteria bacterium]|nr:class I SAM-dependent methyltransferase [Candidatus Poribacteria bacterium]